MERENTLGVLEDVHLAQEYVTGTFQGFRYKAGRALRSDAEAPAVAGW
jgi:hypothetical protein